MKKIMKPFTALLLVLTLLPVTGAAAEALVPGGQVIGLELKEKRVTIAKLDDSHCAAQAAGLQVGDQITQVDETPVSSAADIRSALNRSTGTVQVHYTRQGKAGQCAVQPEITPNGPRLGVYLKDSVTGIGTVSWYDPDTGRFGALGHSVSTGKGSLVEMTRGEVFGASVLRVNTGKVGKPGQLIGALNQDRLLGTLSKNTPQGVFGTIQNPICGQELPVASWEEIKTGDAVIRSTVAGEEIQEYSVKILKIYPSTRQTGRNMLLKVTDPELLEATGGIVQGMSGSPIIQDGKLIGAVTHVLVNDPTTGYGIFIENMLDAAA